MKRLTFFKMSGCGNDFVVIDNRDGQVSDRNITTFVRNICRRKMSVGSDGLILVEKSHAADFKWRFFNSDGSVAEMCGNGARCVARFACLHGIAGDNMTFETDAGIVAAVIQGDRVKINVPDPTDLKTDYTVELQEGSFSICSVNTGVPHVVMPVDDIDSIAVVPLGREIRYHQMFAPAGTNVNFINRRTDDGIALRTYERGVEDETLACGTGAIASAIVAAVKFGHASPVDVLTKSGGHLYIYFGEKNGGFFDIFLEGDARIIYKGELWEDSWNYDQA